MTKALLAPLILSLITSTLCAGPQNSNDADRSLYTLDDSPAPESKTAASSVSEVDTDVTTSFLDSPAVESAPLFEDKNQ